MLQVLNLGDVRNMSNVSIQAHTHTHTHTPFTIRAASSHSQPPPILHNSFPPTSFDLFPHTPHVELMVAYTRNSSAASKTQ